MIYIYSPQQQQEHFENHLNLILDLIILTEQNNFSCWKRHAKAVFCCKGIMYPKTLEETKNRYQTSSKISTGYYIVYLYYTGRLKKRKFSF